MTDTIAKTELPAGASHIGVYLVANRGDFQGQPDFPARDYSVVCASNGKWFGVDSLGSVQGDPESVEREALALPPEMSGDGVVDVVIGLARLAQRIGGA